MSRLTATLIFFLHLRLNSYLFIHIFSWKLHSNLMRFLQLFIHIHSNYTRTFSSSRLIFLQLLHTNYSQESSMFELTLYLQCWHGLSVSATVFFVAKQTYNTRRPFIVIRAGGSSYLLFLIVPTVVVFLFRSACQSSWDVKKLSQITLFPLSPSVISYIMHRPCFLSRPPLAG